MRGNEASVIVVGGGIGGMTAACALADLGLDVILLEREAGLGGHAAAWACMATDECARCSACTTDELIRRVAGQGRVRTIVGALVRKVEGQAGAFKMHVEPSGTRAQAHVGRPDWRCTGPEVLTAGRILLSTGFEPYDPAGSPLLSHGRLEEVYTTREVDNILRRDAVEEFLPADISGPRIAFLQCVGSRDRSRGRNYCSQFCCKTTVRLANRLMHIRPGADITIYYIDLQIMGKQFRAFFEKMKGKVRFLQGVPDQVDYGWDERSDVVTLRSKDPETGEAIANEFDRVVLSIGIAAARANEELARTFGVELDESGFIRAGGGCLTSRAGVFAAGASTGPTDIGGTRVQSLAAAASIARDLGRDTISVAAGA